MCIFRARLKLVLLSLSVGADADVTYRIKVTHMNGSMNLVDLNEFRKSHSKPSSSSPAPGARSERVPLVMRKFQTLHQRSDGQIKRTDHIAPAIPVFEAAFSAFAHGSLVTTTRGQIAVEDLEPGMKVVTREHGSQPIQWIGAMRLVPEAAKRSAHDIRMNRIMADSYGFTRPERDLIVGPGARLLRKARSPEGDDMLVPVRTLSDGESVTDITPQRAVMVHHIALRKHATILVNGLEMESFHPGSGFERSMGQNMLSLFLSLFAHINRPEDFGRMSYERLPLVSPEGLEVA